MQLLVASHATVAATTANGHCATARDCGLNGQCSPQGRCACQAAWSGNPSCTVPRADRGGAYNLLHHRSDPTFQHGRGFHRRRSTCAPADSLTVCNGRGFLRRCASRRAGRARATGTKRRFSPRTSPAGKFKPNFVRYSPRAWRALDRPPLTVLVAAAPADEHRLSRRGGGGFYDNTSGLWLMWVSEMAGGCGMATWTSNSRTILASSPDPLGLYTREAVQFPVWTHESVVTRGQLRQRQNAAIT